MIAFIIFTITVLSPLSSILVQAASPYDSGYSHGCDDADVSYFQRYINQPDKGPTFHTVKFMNGYNAGFSTCSPSSESPSAVSSAPQSSSPQQPGDINWYKLCTNPVVDILISEPCASLTTSGGYGLTPAGQHALACIGGGTLAALTGNLELLSMRGAAGCRSSSSSSNDPIGSLISGLFN